MKHSSSSSSSYITHPLDTVTLLVIVVVCVSVSLVVVVVVPVVVFFVDHVTVVGACQHAFSFAHQTLVVVTAGNDINSMTATELCTRVSGFSKWFKDRGVKVVVLDVTPHTWDFIANTHRVV